MKGDWVIKKSVFEYDNFREYLKDRYEEAKAKDPKFSFRYFSRIAGSKSPSFLKHVMDGERNLTAKHIENLARGFKLSEEETFFFRNLVNLNQSATVDERQIYIKRILQSKEYRKLHPLSTAQYELFTKWYFVPIRELVALPGFVENPEWIAKQFNFAVSAQDVKFAIAELTKLGLLKRNGQGKLIQSEPHVTTQDNIVSSSLAKSHQELIKRGAESIDRVPREQRDILGVTFAVSSESMGKIKEKVLNFRREMVELLSSEQNPDTVYQFHLLLFPLAQLTQNGKGK